MRTLLLRLRYLIPRYRQQYELDMQAELAALAELAGPRELGNVTVAAENARIVSGFPLLHALGSDVRYCLRGLLRERAFTAIAVASLALGMAANISIFGLMDTLLWSELPVADPDQLVSFENTSRSYFGYLEFAKHSAGALRYVLAQSQQTETAIDLGSGSTRGPVGLSVVIISARWALSPCTAAWNCGTRLDRQ